jgi:hypothetical protein
VLRRDTNLLVGRLLPWTIRFCRGLLTEGGQRRVQDDENDDYSCMESFHAEPHCRDRIEVLFVALLLTISESL